MELIPDCRGTVAVHESVPVAFPELPVVLFVHVTKVTPTLSEAVPISVTSKIFVVELSVGAEIEIVGSVVSALGTLTEIKAPQGSQQQRPSIK